MNITRRTILHAKQPIIAMQVWQGFLLLSTGDSLLQLYTKKMSAVSKSTMRSAQSQFDIDATSSIKTNSPVCAISFDKVSQSAVYCGLTSGQVIVFRDLHGHGLSKMEYIHKVDGSSVSPKKGEQSYCCLGLVGNGLFVTVQPGLNLVRVYKERIFLKKIQTTVPITCGSMKYNPKSQGPCLFLGQEDGCPPLVLSQSMLLDSPSTFTLNKAKQYLAEQTLKDSNINLIEYAQLDNSLLCANTNNQLMIFRIADPTARRRNTGSSQQNSPSRESLDPILCSLVCIMDMGHPILSLKLDFSQHILAVATTTKISFMKWKQRQKAFKGLLQKTPALDRLVWTGTDEIAFYSSGSTGESSSSSINYKVFRTPVTDEDD